MLEHKEYSKVMQILERMECSAHTDAMWEQLLNKCREECLLGLVVRCAVALGNMSLARYYRKIMKISSTAKTINKESSGHSSRSDGSFQQDWMIQAKMLQWNKEFQNAEDLYVSHNRIDEALHMYENVKMFPNAIALASRSNHPETSKMKDRFMQWLLDTDQCDKAATIHVSTENYIQAIELYMNANLPAKAATVILHFGIVQPSHLLERVCNALEDVEMYETAGDIYQRCLGQRQRALERFVQTNAFSKAVAIAREYVPNQVVSLEEAWGDYLSSIHHIEDALSHYREAHALRKAIQLAISSKLWDKASIFMQQVDDSDDGFHIFYEQLADHYIAINQLQTAETYLKKANSYEKIVLMYANAFMWDRAISVAKSSLSQETMLTLFTEQAVKMEHQGHLQQAEALYLSIHKSDCAIEMYKKHRDYSKVIELVSKYCAQETLVETHNLLAKQLEMEGNQKEAEHHFASAGNWLAAVNMYRKHDLWEEAIRVAKYSGDTEHIQRVAYAYAVHKGGTLGVPLLAQTNLLTAAIDFAAANASLEHALELARDHCPDKMPNLHFQYAVQLEDEQRYLEAEEQFVKANKTREAIDMYIHRHSWPDAVRVATQFQPSSIPIVFVAQAQLAVKEHDFELAEEMFLRANKPELVLQMYQNQGLFNDAMRIAETYVPHLVDKLNLSSSSPSSSSSQQQQHNNHCVIKEDYLQKGLSMQHEQRYNDAIDMYLQAIQNDTLDMNDLQQIWTSAIQVATSFCPDRYQQVLQTVTSRLVDIGNHESAIDILYQVNEMEDAVNLAIQYKCWNKAMSMSKGHRSLADRVTKAMEYHTMVTTNTEEATSSDVMLNSESSLDIYASQGEWTKIWTLLNTSKASNQICTKYAALQMQQALASKDDLSIFNAVETLYNHAAPDYDSHCELYINLTQTILSFDMQRQSALDYNEMIQRLRSVLYTLRSTMNHSNEELEHVFLTIHFTAMLQNFIRYEMLEQACKCALTLLQYSGTWIPADKAYYTAGQMCMQQNYNSLAFQLFNHYIDLIEAMEDNTDGGQTSIPNKDFSMTSLLYNNSTTIVPSHHYVTQEETREEVRDWVLSQCIDPDLDPSLPTRQNAKGTIYEVLYSDPISLLSSSASTNTRYCRMTGYPLDLDPNVMIIETQDEERITVNKDDWSLLVSKTNKCPWTEEDQSIE